MSPVIKKQLAFSRDSRTQTAGRVAVNSAPQYRAVDFGPSASKLEPLRRGRREEVYPETAPGAPPQMARFCDTRGCSPRASGRANQQRNFPPRQYWHPVGAPGSWITAETLSLLGLQSRFRIPANRFVASVPGDQTDLLLRDTEIDHDLDVSSLLTRRLKFRLSSRSHEPVPPTAECDAIDTILSSPVMNIGISSQN